MTRTVFVSFVLFALVAACGASPASTAPSSSAASTASSASASSGAPAGSSGASAASASPSAAPGATSTHDVAVMDFTDGGSSSAPSGFGASFADDGSRSAGGSAANARSGPTQLPPQITGRLQASAVERVLNESRARFAACAARFPPSSGDLVSVKFVVDAKGQVSSSTDGGSKTADADLAACCQRLVLNLTFPAPDAGQATVVAPMKF